MTRRRMRVLPDILLLIAQDLAQRGAVASLARLSLASLQVHALVVPTLYRSVDLSTESPARAFHRTMLSKPDLGAHVRRILTTPEACYFLFSWPTLFDPCTNLAALEFSSRAPVAAFDLLGLVRSASGLRSVIISRAEQPLGTINMLTLRRSVTARLEDLHVSDMENAATENARHHARPYDYAPFARLRTFSCAYAVDVSLSPAAADQKLRVELLPACVAFAALPALERLCVFVCPPDAAALVGDGQFCSDLRLRTRTGLRITLAAVEESNMRAILQRDRGWTDVGQRLLAHV